MSNWKQLYRDEVACILVLGSSIRAICPQVCSCRHLDCQSTTNGRQEQNLATEIQADMYATESCKTAHAVQVLDV